MNFVFLHSGDEHVCLSVCPRGYLWNKSAIFTNFSVHVAYGRGSVLLRQGDEIPRSMGSFWVFLPH